MQEHPKPGRYRHYKGGLYTVQGTVRHSETEEWMVLYLCERDNSLWVRPLAMWHEEVAPGRQRFSPEIS
uniref:DUF1653 domain-containing protein n=1 Tax=Magnetococcus massalia (strain MO-1) TaxID=451514 RepID=A0A1S7LGY8_MAGMO|nr:Conserved protein of unknown function [Candidatus Magnetococcus massalia]